MAPQITKILQREKRNLERCVNCASPFTSQHFDIRNLSLEQNYWSIHFFFRQIVLDKHISQSSRLLAKIPGEMSKRLSLPTLDHFCGNLKHMFQVLEEQQRKRKLCFFGCGFTSGVSCHSSISVPDISSTLCQSRPRPPQLPAWKLSKMLMIQRRNFPFLIDLCWRAHVL